MKTKLLVVMLLVLAACGKPEPKAEDRGGITQMIDHMNESVVDIGKTMDALKEENMKLKAELAKRQDCTMPKGQIGKNVSVGFKLFIGGGVRYPDGFTYQCTENGLTVLEDPLDHNAKPEGLLMSWQSGGPICKVRPTDTGKEICDEKRAAEDARRDKLRKEWGIDDPNAPHGQELQLESVPAK